MKRIIKKERLAAAILAQLLELSYEPPTLAGQIKSLLMATKKSLEFETKEQLNGIVISVEKINKQIKELAPKKDIELIDKIKLDIEKMNERLKENQKFIDNMVYENERKDFTNNFPIVKQ